MATCFPVLVERARSVLSLILVSGCEQWRKQVYGELALCSEKLYMCVCLLSSHFPKWCA